jgi:ABC-2 type transport system ATP-binding protein
MMLQLNGVTKRFGGLTAVHTASFTARPGEILGYLGPNGSGKSTTVKMICGLLTPTMGTITYNGRDIQRDLLAHRRRIGYVPESPDVYSYLTGPEYLTLIGRLREIKREILEEKIIRFLQLFGIYDDRYAQLSAYSKGMRQKILIAAALLHDPEIIILDEPSSGLDIASTLVLKHLIRGLAAQGKVILYSSHVLELVEQTCSSVVILRQGRVVASDRIERLRALMSQPSLEQVFTQLAVHEDVEQVARDLLETMQL